MENKPLKKMNWPLLIFTISAIALFLVASSLAYLKVVRNKLASNVSVLLIANEDEIVSTLNNTLPIYYETINNEFSKINKENINSNTLSNIYEEFSFIKGIGYYERNITVDNINVNNEKKSYYFDGKINEYKINFNQSITFDKIENNKISLLNLKDFFIDPLNDEYVALFYYPYSYTKTVQFIDNTQKTYTYECYFYAIYSINNYINSAKNIFYNSSYYDFAIMNDSGLFYTSSLTNNNLKYLINNDDKTYEYLALLNNENTTLKLINDNYFISKRILNDYNDSSLYFLSIANNNIEKIIYKDINTLTNIYAIFVAISIVLSVIISIILLYKVTNIFTLSKYKLKYTNNYVIICKGNGKILFMNALFKKGIENAQTYDNINQFDVILDDNLTPLKNNLRLLKPFIAEFLFNDNSRKYIHFIVLKNKGAYILLGDLEFSKQFSNNKVEELAYKDKLTALSNTNALINILNKYCLTKDLNNKKAILYFDIIKFKKYNNLFGKEFGDEIILKLADILKTITKDNEQLFSLGADKFVILINEFIDYETLKEGRCKEIYDTLIKPFSISMNEVKLDVAIGIFNIDFNMYPTINAITILKNAEIASLKAKNFEDRKICIYDKGIYQIIKRDEIIANDIENAIKNNEFVVYFQPQFDLLTNKVNGFESLLRWNNIKYKNDSPYEYIRIAEKKGLIIAISKQILVQSFKAAKILYDNGYVNAHISVNISIAQLMQSGFVNEFLSYYKEYNLPYSLISIEITETMLITSFSEIKEKLELIRSYGIKVYIDDFGMGYSSLLYLNDLPVDYIKIDKEFISHLQHSKNSRIIVSKLIAMATELGLQVVAEGVETNYQVNFLLKNKCQFIQGWIISKAKDVTCLEEMMNISKKVNNNINDEKEDNNEKLDISMFNKNNN